MDLVDVVEVVRPRAEREIPPWRTGDRYVAGGTWLFSEPQPGARRLIDLSSIPWTDLTPLPGSRSGLRISATCTYAVLSHHASKGTLGAAGALFAHAIATLSSSFKTYGSATVGGNICLAYAKSMMAPVMCALGASYELVMPGAWSVRHVPAEAFQTGVLSTIRRPGEYLRSLTVPSAVLEDRYALEKVSYTPTSHATAMAIACVVPPTDVSAPLSQSIRPARSARLVISAAVSRPVSLRLANDASTRALHDAVETVLERSEILDTPHAGRGYRRAMVHHVAERAWDRVHGEEARDAYEQ